MQKNIKKLIVGVGDYSREYTVGGSVEAGHTAELKNTIAAIQQEPEEPGNIFLLINKDDELIGQIINQPVDVIYAT
jgi:hypothetical protein